MEPRKSSTSGGTRKRRGELSRFRPLSRKVAEQEEKMRPEQGASLLWVDPPGSPSNSLMVYLLISDLRSIEPKGEFAPAGSTWR